MRIKKLYIRKKIDKRGKTGPSRRGHRGRRGGNRRWRRGSGSRGRMRRGHSASTRPWTPWDRSFDTIVSSAPNLRSRRDYQPGRVVCRRRPQLRRPSAVSRRKGLGSGKALSRIDLGNRILKRGEDNIVILAEHRGYYCNLGLFEKFIS